MSLSFPVSRLRSLFFVRKGHFFLYSRQLVSRGVSNQESSSGETDLETGISNRSTTGVDTSDDQTALRMKEDTSEGGEHVNPVTGERGGPRGLEPTRYGDWERKGRVSDF